jgi:tetratricopeptide (TPR) repeat protein
MLRDDYVMRLAVQLGKALVHILGLSRRKQYPAALAAIEEALDQLLGLKLDAVLGLSAGQLVAFLTLGGTEASWDKVAFLAALLREAGAIHAAEDRPAESYECYLQALHLLLEVRLREEAIRLPEYAPSVEEIVARLDAYILPASTNLALMRYYERTGAYGQAEDALFEALEVEPGNADVVETGLAFYERLRQQSDEALVAGNLPRDEVEAGLAEWQAYPQNGGEAV